MKCKWPNCQCVAECEVKRADKRFWRLVFYIVVGGNTFNLLLFGLLWYLK